MNIVFELDFYVLKAGGSLRVSSISLDAADELYNSEYRISNKANAASRDDAALCGFLTTHELCRDNTESLF